MPQWVWILLAIIVVLLLIILIVSSKKIRAFAYKMVLFAEDYIKGSKKGEEKFDFVVAKIRDGVPKPFQWFLTDKRIKNIIEWAVAKMKDALK